MQLNRQEALSGVCKLLFIGVFCLYFYIYITLTSYVEIHEYIHLFHRGFATRSFRYNMNGHA